MKFSTAAVQKLAEIMVFEDFTQGHAAVLEWIDANGYRIVGPYREIYIKHDKADLSNSTTEIQFPVEKA